MTTGPRCSECDSPLIEAGSAWMCLELDCDQYGIAKIRICDDAPDENGRSTMSWQPITVLEKSRTEVKETHGDV